MKDTNENLLDFSLVKGMIAPAIIVYNNDPESEDSKELMLDSFVRSLVILKSQSIKCKISFEQVVDNCLGYFNQLDVLTEAFTNYFKANNSQDKAMKEETIKVLQITATDKCLQKVKELLLLVDERAKNDCNN